MIDALITGLSKGLELSAEEIADTLWLALQIEESQPELSVRAELRENPPQPSLEQGEPEVLPAETSTHSSESEETASSQSQDEPKAGIYPRNPQESLVGSGLSLRVPDAPSLREPLTLARALKPLMRRMPSGSTLVLDEAATTQQIAETGLWLPVLKPTLEPWLDLELVVDEGISMQIWRHTIGELERLLKNYGIFRDVRVWGLIADDSEASDLPRLVQIRRGIGATAKNQSPRSPAELIDPSGRRLILVVSDCVSPQWRDGKLTKTLELWAKQGSMAIVQMLPKWLWKRTALGRASEVRLQGLNPGEFNQKLIAKGVSLWDELEETRGVKVPIFTLEPDRVATWAQMLSGKGSTWTAGYVFKLDPLPARQGKDLFNLDIDRSSPEQRVQAFRVTASPMARKLAGLLAVAPVISLPIVRLIQETLLKESQQVHVAEVFLGGLLKPLSEINPETNPNYVQYEFMDGIRELLSDSVPSGYVLDVVDAVSKYVARKLGLSLEEFAAVLRNIQEVTDVELAEKIRYFATVTAEILRHLGGKYATFSDSLENTSTTSFGSTISDQKSDIIDDNTIDIDEALQDLKKSFQLREEKDTVEDSNYNYVTIAGNKNFRIGNTIYQGTGTKEIYNNTQIIGEIFQRLFSLSESSLVDWNWGIKLLEQKQLPEIRKRLTDTLGRDRILMDVSIEKQQNWVNRSPLATDQTLQINGEDFDILDANKMLIETFGRADIEGKLLILGAPGAGKTTALLSLAEQLVEGAISQPRTVIPVIFELSTWRNDNQSIESWLIEQLYDLHGGNRKSKLYEQWIERQVLLPLLDGLDELGLEPQKKCTQKLNEFAEHYPNLVVCCRVKEFETVDIKLRNLRGAVCLQSLSDSQIQHYFDSLQRPELWGAIQTSPSLQAMLKPTREGDPGLLRIPLFVKLVADVYDPQQPISGKTDLLDKYIDRQLSFDKREFDRRRELNNYKWAYKTVKLEPDWKQTRSHLRWLAQNLQTNNKAEFKVKDIQPNFIQSLRLQQSGLPWDFTRFLNYCVERRLLVRTGWSYTFLHRELLDHFARSSDRES
jgi:NACHT domain